jgi:hypothetical protein
MGCWAASLCDPHAPVASAARHALLLAFPSHAKQAEAMGYCREAVIAVRLQELTGVMEYSLN